MRCVTSPALSGSDVSGFWASAVPAHINIARAVAVRAVIFNLELVYRQGGRPSVRQLTKRKEPYLVESRGSDKGTEPRAIARGYCHSTNLECAGRAKRRRRFG